MSRVFPFIASFSIFLGSFMCLLLSWMVFVSDEPWTLDQASHRNLHVPDGQTTLDYLKSIQMLDFVRQQYRLNAALLFLASAFIMAIVFAAPRNRPLIFLTLMIWGLWLGLLGRNMGWYFQPVSEHRKLYIALIVCNLVGICSYCLHILLNPRGSSLKLMKNE